MTRDIDSAASVRAGCRLAEHHPAEPQAAISETQTARELIEHRVYRADRGRGHAGTEPSQSFPDLRSSPVGLVLLDAHDSASRSGSAADWHGDKAARAVGEPL